MSFYNFIKPGIEYDETLPVVGKWVSRIGRVIDITATPCSVSPEIWILAAFQALPTLLVSPITPSATDYLIVRSRERVEEEGTKGGSAHGRRTKFGFDVWDAIEATDQPGHKPKWWRFALGSMAAELMWYFVCADAITGFLVNWTSLAYQWAGCVAPGEPWGCVYIKNEAAWWPGGLDSTTFGYWLDGGGSGFTRDGYGIGWPSGYSPTVSWSWNYNPAQGGGAFPPSGSMNLIDSSTGEILQTSQTPHNSPTGMWNQNVWWNADGATTPRHVSLRWDGGGMQDIVSGQITVTSQKLSDMIMPFGIKTTTVGEKTSPGLLTPYWQTFIKDITKRDGVPPWY